MAISFLNVLIGFLLSNIAFVLGRNKISSKSPTKFDFIFWIKDNWIKVVHSLVVSCLINLAFQLNLTDLKQLTGQEWYGIYSMLIGFAPDVFMGILKDKLKWLQPKKVTIKDRTYDRE